VIDKTFTTRIEGLIEFPDAMGELIGPLEREWLVSFTAPEKRGKTWILVETAFQAIMQRKRVLFISFEMSESQVKQRIWNRLTGTSEKYNERRFVLLPVLDCIKNQEGTCEKEENKNEEILLDEGDEVKPLFKKSMQYKPCVYCKEKRLRDYELDYWYEKASTRKFTKELVKEKADNLRSMFGDLLRVRCFPAFTASSRDIKATLKELEVNENYYTDVLINDYLDIAGREVGDYSERGNIDATWKMAKNVAAVNKLLHITVDQSSKRTYKDDITLFDTSEDKRKNAHVDVKIAINDFASDMDENIDEDIKILKLSMLAHRHRGIRLSREVIVLQQLGIGQPLIECSWYVKK
jgi:hypothetical protein